MRSKELVTAHRKPTPSPSLPASLCSFSPSQEGISPNKTGSSSGPPRSQGRTTTLCVPRSPARGSAPPSPRAPGSSPNVSSPSVTAALRLEPPCTPTWTDSLWMPTRACARRHFWNQATAPCPRHPGSGTQFAPHLAPQISSPP